MTQDQYEKMATIMQCGRIFAEQIQKCMENSGLMEQKYEFSLRITNGCYMEDGADVIKVELDKNICHTDEEEYKKTSMEQYKFGRKGWMIYLDPVAKKGTVPPEVRISKADDSQGRAKAATKPYPPDGLWLSSRDDYPYVDGGK